MNNDGVKILKKFRQIHAVPRSVEESGAATQQQIVVELTTRQSAPVHLVLRESPGLEGCAGQ